MGSNRIEAAAALAEELLTDVELHRITPVDVARKASRLARLTDDDEAMAWLSYEVSGYPETGLNKGQAAAVRRSGRQVHQPDGSMKYWTASLAGLVAQSDGLRLAIQASTDTGGMALVIQSRNQHVVALTNAEQLQGRVVGAVYDYVARKQIELRFGDAAESAFEQLRKSVDTKVATLVPEASNKIAAAFEGVSSDNPERWANAAMQCRRLIKAVADALQPAGPPVGQREMTDGKYINRLIAWIEEHVGDGQTLRDVVVSDLEDFGKRIDALDDAGHKGAHAEVTQLEAARFVTGAYLLVGDILNLNPEALPESSTSSSS